jgi:threonine dehydratase
MATASANEVTVADVERARHAGQDVVRHTPVLPSATLTDASGADVVLKAESLQRTGAFKLRGALAKMAALGDACANGVVAASAGNHAQALAHAARARSVPCEVFMPTDSSIAKAEGAEALGATVRLVGTSVEECMEAARERAHEAGFAFVHPFDDPDVIAGQGTIGLELLEDVPDLAKVIIPVGGGGLASGTAIAVKSAKPEVEVVGVQVEAFAPFPESMRTGRPVTVPPSLTIADGIAVKRPGEITLALMREWVDDVVTVGEDDVAEAMVLLLEKAKLVVEGAGAVGVAALLAGKTAAAPAGSTAIILSGGNVDAGLLAMVARRHETEAGRRLAILTRLQDRPGAMARLLGCVGDTGANLLDVQHVREALDLHVRETAVQLVLETRGPEHAAQVLEAMKSEGYEARTLQ